ncbi:MAG: helix-turn-helix domain-containing protein [Pirellulaceae bacterium]|nr:helix-turn-helix domain-containing protein [Pirellulaceae bacterium]
MMLSFLTVPQVAESLGIDPGKVLAWIRKGELVAVNIAHDSGGRPRWRIREAALDAFLLRRQSQPPTPVRRRTTARPVVKQYV